MELKREKKWSGSWLGHYSPTFFGLLMLKRATIKVIFVVFFVSRTGAKSYNPFFRWLIHIWLDGTLLCFGIDHP
ncbi:hypothetical protein F5H01DRAFT_357512 [Linnemannia elongata]|nr:hypothetical protein F5H01DRAFT_357508 [Linnemannia elongata]KAK5799454.1 hypothetical protein F5H01DRAFT_357512 [Linnemannia elongata]